VICSSSGLIAHYECAKLASYAGRQRGWRTFLLNHAPRFAAMDLFGVPTHGFDLLYAYS